MSIMGLKLVKIVKMMISLMQNDLKTQKIKRQIQSSSQSVFGTRLHSLE